MESDIGSSSKTSRIMVRDNETARQQAPSKSEVANSLQGWDVNN